MHRPLRLPSCLRLLTIHMTARRGGKVAMSLALHPSLPRTLLSKLIVADIAPSRNALSPEFQSYIRAMQAIEEARVSTRKDAQHMLAETEKDAMVRAFLLTNLHTDSASGGGGEGGEGLKFKVPLDILAEAIPELGSFPYAEGERSWEGPTMFIKGTKSKCVLRLLFSLCFQVNK